VLEAVSLDTRLDASMRVATVRHGTRSIDGLVEPAHPDSLAAAGINYRHRSRLGELRRDR